MKFFLLNIFILIPFLVVGQTTLPADSSTCKKITFIQGGLDTISSSEFEITRIEIKNDCLEVDIRYGGGCGRVNLKLITNGLVLTIAPPQVALFLKFTDEDTCKALMYRTIFFDLTEYKSEAKDGGIFLMINGAGKVYSFLYK